MHNCQGGVAGGSVVTVSKGGVIRKKKIEKDGCQPCLEHDRVLQLERLRAAVGGFYEPEAEEINRYGGQTSRFIVVQYIF